MKKTDAKANLKKVISRGFNPWFPKIFPPTMEIPQIDVESMGRIKIPFNILFVDWLNLTYVYEVILISLVGSTFQGICWQSLPILSDKER